MIVQASLGGSGGGGGGSIPAGTTGQTLYYASNGTTVTPTSNFTNDGAILNFTTSSLEGTGNITVGNGASVIKFNIGTDYEIASSGTDGDSLIWLGNRSDPLKAWQTINPVSGISTYNAPNGNLFTGARFSVAGLQAFANNAAAVGAGLAVGDFYRISVAGTSTVAVVE